MMSVRSYARIAEVPPEAWNELVGRDRLICRHEYVQAVEESAINRCLCFYPVVYDNGRIVAHTSVYLMGTELDAFARGLLKRFITFVRKAWPHFLILHFMECGTPVALGCTICLRNGTADTEALLCLVREVERLAAQHGTGVVLFRDFHDNEVARFDVLKGLDYARIPNLQATYLRLDWADFEDYLSSMRSEYRCNVLAQMRRFKQSGATIEFLPDYAGCAPDLARLWRNAFDRAKEYRREVLDVCFFENMSRRLGPRTAVLLARLQGEPIGFLLLLFDDETMTTLFSGLDYSRHRETAAYFNLFYKAIEIALERKHKGVDFGITTIAPKLDFGATITPLHMYMKHRSPLLNRIVPRAFAMMTPPVRVHNRNVFKKA